MWSLPDIQRLNSHAQDNRVALENAVETGFLNGEALECECAGWGRTDCTGDLRHYLWFDIFSDDPKGILTLCERHDGYFGLPTEGYFTCDDCQRVMIENYTWERYSTYDEDACEVLCLPCAAERYISDDDNWLTLTPESVAALNFDRVRKAKHVIGVRMPVPKSIEAFGDGVTLDSSSGGIVRGFSSADSTPDSGVRELRDQLTEAMEAGHKRALLILDGGYQFAVSIGVYVDAQEQAQAA
jgi:hypothetical protein